MRCSPPKNSKKRRPLKRDAARRRWDSGRKSVRAARRPLGVPTPGQPAAWPLRDCLPAARARKSRPLPRPCPEGPVLFCPLCHRARNCAHFSQKRFKILKQHLGPDDVLSNPFTPSEVLRAASFELAFLFGLSLLFQNEHTQHFSPRLGFPGLFLHPDVYAAAATLTGRGKPASLRRAHFALCGSFFSFVLCCQISSKSVLEKGSSTD